MSKPIFYTFGKVDLPDDLKKKIVEKMIPFYCLSDPEIGRHIDGDLVLFCSRKADNLRAIESGQHMIEGLVEGYRLALGPVKKYCVGFYKWSSAAWVLEQQNRDDWFNKSQQGEYQPFKKVKLTIQHFGSIEEANDFIRKCMVDSRHHYIWEQLDREKFYHNGKYRYWLKFGEGKGAEIYLDDHVKNHFHME